jgi:hypothetical protein
MASSSQRESEAQMAGTGSSPDDHVRNLVTQGVSQGIGQNDKRLNGSFGKRMSMAKR